MAMDSHKFLPITSLPNPTLMLTASCHKFIDYFTAASYLNVYAITVRLERERPGLAPRLSQTTVFKRRSRILEANPLDAWPAVFSDKRMSRMRLIGIL